MLAACTLSALAVSAYSAAGNSVGTNQPDLLTPENWRYRTFGVVDPTLTDPISQWTNDAAGDLLATIWEYAFATQPLNSDSSARITGEVIPDGTNRWLLIVVPRDRRRAVNMAGRASTNLVQWSLGAPGTTVAGDATNRLILRSTTPVKDAPKQFMGAEISLPQPGGQRLLPLEEYSTLREAAIVPTAMQLNSAFVLTCRTGVGFSRAMTAAGERPE